ncbi:hypothetical protein FFLO_03571 [Filobasidium floriforme]|uniref:Integrase core domain-containing protein n=1 Tax=Filobasidium floriforme TaxID=5210 RepID=A0A8K0NT21_9TREE|nr:hypothetical protein FFLO_03571 [Filobasidium floriforme]
MTSVVVTHINQHDPQHRESPTRITLALGQKGIHVKRFRDIVTQIMRDHFPDGFLARAPSYRTKKGHPALLTSYGPNDQLSIDGHDKLIDIGFAIYGMRDKFSRKWMSLRAVPNNRSNSITRWLFLELVHDMKGEEGIPLQVTSDHGTEVLDIFSDQSTLRELAQPQLNILMEDLGVLAAPEPHRFLPSTKNITVERGWRPLVDKFHSKFIVSTQNAILTGDYVPGNNQHRIIYLYLFAPLVQKELEDYVHLTNCSIIRKQPHTNLPSGKSPNTIYHCEGTNCLLPLDEVGMNQVRTWMDEITISHPRLLSFIEEDEEQWASQLFEHCAFLDITLGFTVNLSNAWMVFRSMAEHIDEVPYL